MAKSQFISVFYGSVVKCDVSVRFPNEMFYSPQIHARF